MNRVQKLILGSLGSTLVALPSFSYAEQALCPEGIVESNSIQQPISADSDLSAGEVGCGLNTSNFTLRVSNSFTYYTLVSANGQESLSSGSISYYATVYGSQKIIGESVNNPSTAYLATVYSGGTQYAYSYSVIDSTTLYRDDSDTLAGSRLELLGNVYLNGANVANDGSSVYISSYSSRITNSNVELYDEFHPTIYGSGTLTLNNADITLGNKVQTVQFQPAVSGSALIYLSRYQNIRFNSLNGNYMINLTDSTGAANMPASVVSYATGTPSFNGAIVRNYSAFAVVNTLPSGGADGTVSLNPVADPTQAILKNPLLQSAYSDYGNSFTFAGSLYLLGDSKLDGGVTLISADGISNPYVRGPGSLVVYSSLTLGDGINSLTIYSDFSFAGRIVLSPYQTIDIKNGFNDIALIDLSDAVTSNTVPSTNLITYNVKIGPRLYNRGIIYKNNIYALENDTTNKAIKLVSNSPLPTVFESYLLKDSSIRTPFNFANTLYVYGTTTVYSGGNVKMVPSSASEPANRIEGTGTLNLDGGILSLGNQLSNIEVFSTITGNGFIYLSPYQHLSFDNLNGNFRIALTDSTGYSTPPTNIINYSTAGTVTIENQGTIYNNKFYSITTGSSSVTVAELATAPALFRNYLMQDATFASSVSVSGSTYLIGLTNINNGLSVSADDTVHPSILGTESLVFKGSLTLNNNVESLNVNPVFRGPVADTIGMIYLSPYQTINFESLSGNFRLALTDLTGAATKQAHVITYKTTPTRTFNLINEGILYHDLAYTVVNNAGSVSLIDAGTNPLKNALLQGVNIDREVSLSGSNIYLMGSNTIGSNGNLNFVYANVVPNLIVSGSGNFALTDGKITLGDKVQSLAIKSEVSGTGTIYMSLYQTLKFDSLSGTYSIYVTSAAGKSLVQGTSIEYKTLSGATVSFTTVIGYDGGTYKLTHTPATDSSSGYLQITRDADPTPPVTPIADSVNDGETIYVSEYETVDYDLSGSYRFAFKDSASTTPEANAVTYSTTGSVSLLNDGILYKGTAYSITKTNPAGTPPKGTINLNKLATPPSTLRNYLIQETDLTGNVNLEGSTYLLGANTLSSDGNINLTYATGFEIPTIIGSGSLAINGGAITLGDKLQDITIVPEVSGSGTIYMALYQTLTFHSLSGEFAISLTSSSGKAIQQTNLITYTTTVGGTVKFTTTSLSYNGKTYTVEDKKTAIGGVLSVSDSTAGLNTNTSGNSQSAGNKIIIPGLNSALSTSFTSAALIGIMGNSMHQRVGELMFPRNNFIVNKANSKIAAYTRAYNSTIKIGEDLESKINLNVIEVGADYKLTPYNYLGALIQVGVGDSAMKKAEKDITIDKNEIKTTALGLYYMGFLNGGYFIDSALRFGALNQDATLTNDDKFKLNQSAVNFSLEAGRKISYKAGYFITPRFEINASNVAEQTFKTDSGQEIKLNAVNSLKLQTGIIAGKAFNVGKGSVQPYLQATLLNETDGKSTVILNNKTYESTVGTGVRTNFGAGVNYLVGSSTTFNLDLSAENGKNYSNTSILFIARIRF